MYIRVYDISWNFGELENCMTPPEFLPEEVEIREKKLVKTFFDNNSSEKEIVNTISNYLYKTEGFYPKDFGFILESEIGDRVYIFDSVLEEKSKTDDKNYTENYGKIEEFSCYGKGFTR